MADTKASAFPAAGVVVGTDSIPVIRAGANMLATAAAVALTGTILNPPYVSGRFYSIGNMSVGTGGALSQNVIAAVPFFIRRSVTISQLGGLVTTLQAGGNAQFAIYAADAVTLLPTGLPLATTGSVSTAAAVVVAANLVSGNTLFAQGLYWFCVNSDNAIAAFQALAAVSSFVSSLIGGTQANVAVGTATSRMARQTATTFGTWPDVTALTWAETTDGKHCVGHFKVA